ncbi:MAG: type II secretion system F family protein [Phycisphaerae bacterium]|nr:type II secretion system F family protein [Phycisphaerae bacterium]
MMNELGLICGLVIVSVAMIVYSLWPKGDEEEEAVLRRMKGQKASDDDVGPRKTSRTSAATDFVRKVAPFAVRPVMPKSDEEMSNLRVRLSNAGFRHESVVTFFLASKTLLGVGLGALALFFTWSSGHETQRIFGISACLAGVGFMLPNIWLWLATKERSQKIRDGLPDSLDLMVISVEAGLGLDAALQRVGDEMAAVHPELAEEFTITTLETQMSVPRAESLEHMATRTGVSQIKSLVAIVTQAERFGTSVAKALRNQADTMRTKRRQAAEERAQKTAVKLMIPLVVFIFPAMGVVLAGPAALQMIRTLSTTPGLQ